MKIETVGKSAINLQKNTDEKINPIDLQRAIHKGKKSEDSFENQVYKCVETAKKTFQEAEFFVVVLFKKERLLHNVVRQYFLARKSCPTPEYDQVVYKYRRKEDDFELLWVVPDKQHCAVLLQNRHLIPLEQMHLIAFVDDFVSGKLDVKARQINGEIPK